MRFIPLGASSYYVLSSPDSSTIFFEKTPMMFAEHELFVLYEKGAEQIFFPVEEISYSYSSKVSQYILHRYISSYQVLFCAIPVKV